MSNSGALSTPTVAARGDGAADLEAHRVALTGHCYRMLGSVADADDAVQETMVRAFRARSQFDGRSTLRTWLLRIATRVCLDALSHRKRRVQPMALSAPGTIHDELAMWPASHWVEPIADACAVPSDSDPAQQSVLRQSIRLAFVAAVQWLPPRQRAALLLTDVLDFSVAETADTLGMTVAAVNSALQRARATLAARGGGLDATTHAGAPPQAALSSVQTELLHRYVAAFERYDVDALVALLRTDATMAMPPFALWLRGQQDIHAWFLGRGAGCRGSRLLPTVACGCPAFGQYRVAVSARAQCIVPLSDEPSATHLPWSLIVLELGPDCIVHMDYFLDTPTLFPRFGLPPALTS